MKYKINKILSIFLIIQIVLVKTIAKYPNLVENYYSNGIYKNISSFLRTVFGWIPFSVGDVLYFLIIVWVVISIVKFYKQKSKNWTGLFFSLTSKLSIVYFLFYLLWGLNYYRLPLQQSLNLKIPEYNTDQLSLLTEKLLIKTQEVHFNITKKDTLPVIVKTSKKIQFKESCDSYLWLANTYPQFKYKNAKVKKSLFSVPLSYMGFSGYLNPFTNEAQVNYKVPSYKIMGIATHEIAHQLGYASESEANFIGFLAAINSKNPKLKYAGYLTALRYCLGEIYQSDKELYKEFYTRLPIGVQKNVLENSDFWKKHNNPLEPVFKKVFDLFLKSNNQKSGIRSYNKMVGLLMAIDIET
jgi:hypothetical protein